MSISVPPRGLAGSLQNRQARPLNGIEVSEAVHHHVMTLADKRHGNAGFLSDRIIEMVEKVHLDIGDELRKQTRLSKVNITYPKVGWSIKIRLEEANDLQWVTGEVELDLERNVRLSIRF